VVKNTGLGLILNKYRNHDDEEIKAAASAVYRQWKQFLKEHAEKKSIEVKSDRKTEEMRKNGRGLILKAFSDATISGHTDPEEIAEIESYNQTLAEQIEREGNIQVFILNIYILKK